MTSKKVHKHYRISSELIEKINKQNNNRFSTETSALEYYLKKGLELEEQQNENINLMHSVQLCIKKITYIEKLLEQLFANKNFATNRNKSHDEALKEFRKRIFKDIYFD